LIDFERATVNWHTPEETAKMLAMMSPANCVKVENAKAYRKRIVGTVYKRVRTEGGRKFQRAEVRFDQISGCLRTPAGGSSRQTILVVEGGSVRSRLMTPREASRLMGLPESYRLPENFNDGYHLAGDGVVVPVVRYLAQHLLNPLALQLPNRRKEAA
jgi:DNA (cytosine-5)-methyltransferase 1